ncbi:MAG: nitrous oxide reductase accessory protein NosL [Leptonema sp. (in: bacteria)]
MKKIAYSLLVIGFLYCAPKAPVDIQVGQEECALCKMKIVDLKFNTQLQTSKGKILHFDSIECLVRWLEQNKEVAIKNAWVKDYTTGEWVVYKDAYYLASKNLPSPMGAFLSSYKNKESVEKIQKEKDGKILEYKDLIHYLIELEKNEGSRHHHHHH